MNTSDEQVMNQFYTNISKAQRLKIEINDTIEKRCAYNPNYDRIRLFWQNSAKNSNISAKSSSSHKSRSSSCVSSCGSISSVESTQRYCNLPIKTSIRCLNQLRMHSMDRSGSTSKSYPTEPNTSSEEEIQEFAYDDTESNNQSKKFQKITNILKEFRVESISEMLYRKKSRQKSNSNLKSIIYNQKSESNSNEAREYTSSIPEQISNDDGLICEIDNKENLVIELEESEEDSQLNDSNIPAPVLRKGSQNQVVIDLKSLSQSKSRYKYQQADKEFRNCYKHSKIGDFARTDRKRISLNMDDFLTKPAEKSMKDANPELEINISKHQSLKIEDYLDDEPWNTNEDKKHPNIKEDLEKLDLDCFSSRSRDPNYIQKERDIESLSSIGKNKDSSIIDLCSQERHKYTPTLDTNCQSSSTRRNPTWFQTDCSNKADEDFTFKTKLDFDKTEDISPKLYYEYESRAKNHPFLISDCSDRSGLGFSDDEYK